MGMGAWPTGSPMIYTDDTPGTLPLLQLHAVLAQTAQLYRGRHSTATQPGWQDLEIERLRGEWSRLTDGDDMSVDEGRQTDTMAAKNGWE